MTDYYQSLSIIRNSLMEDKQSADKEKIKIFLNQFKNIKYINIKRMKRRNRAKCFL